MFGIRWYDRDRNDEALQRTGLTSLSHLLFRRRISVFRHIARLDDVTPANMALRLNVSLNRPPDRTWRRAPGRPRNKWLRNDSTRPTGDLRRRAVDRGHGLDDDDDDVPRCRAATAGVAMAWAGRAKSTPPPPSSAGAGPRVQRRSLSYNFPVTVKTYK